MVGGAGNDTYVVDNAGDVVTEALNEGTDTVQSSITYTLGANVENLTLTGSGDINGTGNALANVITGNSGNNTLDGGAGADTMIGGARQRHLRRRQCRRRGDRSARRRAPTRCSRRVSYTLGANVENLTLTGSANINGTGNGDANVITGNSGDNTLDGQAGDDTLTGGGGNDTLIGGRRHRHRGLRRDDHRFDARRGRCSAISWLPPAAPRAPTRSPASRRSPTAADTAILLVGNGGYATIPAAIAAAVGRRHNPDRRRHLQRACATSPRTSPSGHHHGIAGNGAREPEPSRPERTAPPQVTASRSREQRRRRHDGLRRAFRSPPTRRENPMATSAKYVGIESEHRPSAARPVRSSAAQVRDLQHRDRRPRHYYSKSWQPISGTIGPTKRPGR